MKVTFLTGEFPPMQGGIADYTARLANHLAHEDVSPSVLISRIYDQYRQDNVEKSDIPVFSDLSDWGIRCWPQTKQFLRRHQPDVLHIQYQAAAFDLVGWVNWLPWFLKGWGHRPRIVTTFHDLRIPYLFPKAGPLREQTVLGLARYSDAVICTNSEDATSLRENAWATHVREIPLANNIPVSPPANYDRASWRAQYGLNEDDLVLAYFGFLNESKGGEDLIAILGVLVEAGHKATLLMIGGDVGDSDPSNQAYAQRVRHLITDYQLESRIIFTGFVEASDVSAHLLAADVAVMPYRDGVSFRRTTLIAALQHGLPLVTTSPTHPISLIQPNENMLLAAPKDVSALTQRIIRIANDKALRVRLSQGAKQLGNQFDWATIATQTKAVYQQLMQTREKNENTL
ncbi:MAG: glycosyltransferase family 4 protein [Chloroflexota bacterium]